MHIDMLWFKVTGGWPERENVYANRLQEVLDMYKAVVHAEKQQKEKDKKKQRRPFVSYTVSNFSVALFFFEHRGVFCRKELE